MNKVILAVMKINLKQIKLPWILTIVIFCLATGQILVYQILALNGYNQSYNSFISGGNALWLVVVMGAIFIPARHFLRIVNLGGKRENYFRGCFLTYVILAAFASLVNVVVFYTFDMYIKTSGLFYTDWFGGVVNLIEVFGWDVHGPALAFLQQFAFLFLTACFTHLFCAMQGRWYGTALAVLLIAIICVFPPIEPLRNVMIGYFYIILYHVNAVIQIAACVGIGLVSYALSKPVIARKVF